MALREPATGELNRRVMIRQRTDKPAKDFGLDSAFSGEVWRWASILPVGTAAYAAGVQLDAKVTHRVTFRFLDGISEDHEVVHGAKIYRVRRVADLNGAHRFTVLEVEMIGGVTAGGGVYA